MRRSLVRTLTTPTVRLGKPDWYGYGFGIRAGGTFWHNGGSPGVGAELDVNPKSGYVAVLLSNRSYPAIRPAVGLVLKTFRIP